MKWICPKCGTTASSKCVDERSVFTDQPDGMPDNAHGLVYATTSVEWKENGDHRKFVECSIEALRVDSLRNIIGVLAEYPDLLDELACDHRWHLDGGEDCELHCQEKMNSRASSEEGVRAHPRIVGPSVQLRPFDMQQLNSKKRVREMPTMEEMEENFAEYENIYNRAKAHMEQTKKQQLAHDTLKRIFDEHVVKYAEQNGQIDICKWNADAVKIISADPTYNCYKYEYNVTDVYIKYLSRETWKDGDRDTFVDTIVEINGVTVYEVKKDEVLIQKNK